jgi:hypothetical protein
LGKVTPLPQARLRPIARSPRQTPPLLRKVSALTAAFALAGIAGISACSPPVNTPAAGDLLRLRMCESGGNYAINTGNGYSGAYQFATGTWNSLGFGGQPYQAAPWIQDQAVIKLWRRGGWGSWPGCAASLGLR